MSDTPLRPLPCDLAQGTHFICTCGQTGNRPYCDGSHRGSGKSPMKQDVTEATQRIFWCQCGASGNTPFCDGSHNRQAS